MTHQRHCIKCLEPISIHVFYHSLEHHGVSLCADDQDWLNSIDGAQETKMLYLALLELGLPVQLEKFEGLKTAEILIPKYNLNIELEELAQQQTKQASQDYHGIGYALKKGYTILKISHTMVRTNMMASVNLILQQLEALKCQELLSKNGLS